MRETIPTSNPTILCAVVAQNEITAAAIAEIASVCARDVGQPLLIKTRAASDMRENALTLHLPAPLAAAQHPIWCLACRLACFCPNARVSVLVEADTLFSTTRRPRRRRTATAARERSAA